MNVVSNKPHIYLFRKISDSSPVYVGQQCGETVKSKNHWRSYVTGGDVLSNQFQVLGAQKFWELYRKEIIETCTLEELNRLESLYIAKYNTFNKNNPSGYNLVEFGDSTRGFIHSQQTRDRIREGNIQSKRSRSTHQKNITVQRFKDSMLRKSKEELEEITRKRKLGNTKYTIITPDGIFLGYREAERVLEVDSSVVHYRCNSPIDKWRHWVATKIIKNKYI